MEGTGLMSQFTTDGDKLEEGLFPPPTCLSVAIVVGA